MEAQTFQSYSDLLNPVLLSKDPARQKQEKLVYFIWKCMSARSPAEKEGLIH